MNSRLLLFLVAVTFLPGMQSWARLSANYSIPAETQDSGGVRSVSSSYTIDNGVGGIGALNSGGGNTGKNGYIGQLYDVLGLIVDASPITVNETQTRQLSASQLLDDATFIAVTASSVSWSVLSGPINSISSGGLATAENVYQSTIASVQGSFESKNGSLNLTVVNVGTDDFGSYAGDQMDDAWQVQYFGQPPNPNAAPAADPDGDGDNNLFEYTAGLDPTDPTSRFALVIQNVSGQPSQKNLIFNPLVSGRTYTVQFTTTLTNPNSFSTLTGTNESDNGATRTVTDPNATGVVEYYRVQITKP